MAEPVWTGMGWGVLLALSFSCGAVGVLGFLMLVIDRDRGETPRTIDRLWHQFEEGEITCGEFERLRPAPAAAPLVAVRR